MTSVYVVKQNERLNKIKVYVIGMDKVKEYYVQKKIGVWGFYIIVLMLFFIVNFTVSRNSG